MTETNDVRRMAIMTGLALTALLHGVARAGDIGGFDVVLHEFCGSGSANVFDGGDVVESAFCNTGGDPDIIGGGFDAFDFTQAGSLGASASASASSGINPLTGGGIRIIVELSTIYRPSGFPGGDNPGGLAEGDFMSVLEFRMPADELPWTYYLTIDEDVPFFEGSTSILMENVTESVVLLDLTTETPFIETTLNGNTGDLIRITSTMEGAGNMGPGSRKEYDARFDMALLAPEPATGLMLVLGIATLLRRQRSCSFGGAR